MRTHVLTLMLVCSFLSAQFALAQQGVTPPEPIPMDNPADSGAAEPMPPSPENPPESSPDPPAPPLPGVVDEELQPQPQDLQIEKTSRFTMECPFEFANEIPRKKARDILTEAAKYVESRFPDLLCFKRIGRRYRVVVSIQAEVYSDTCKDPVLGTCRKNDDGEILICMTPKSLQDGETAVHEFVHAILRGNDIRPVSWLEEGVARYIEDRNGLCPAVRDQLVDHGTMTKDELDNATDGCQRAANGWIVAKYCAEIKNEPLGEVLRRTRAELPEPAEAFKGYIKWSLQPAVVGAPAQTASAGGP